MPICTAISAGVPIFTAAVYKLDGDLGGSGVADVLARDVVFDPAPAPLRRDAREDGEPRPLVAAAVLLLALDLLA